MTTHPLHDIHVGRITFGDPQPLPLGGRAGECSVMLPGHSVIGTCSKCRGPVAVPTLWGGVIPPTPTCQNCGATKKAPHGPIIEME